MKEIVQMPNTGASSWLARWLKMLCLSSVIGLIGCSTSYIAPKLPESAADLMSKEPTGSEYLSNVSTDMRRWEEMLHDWLTRSQDFKAISEP